MKISINSKEENVIRDSISITEILKLKDVTRPDMVSVQVNGKFVRKEDFANTLVKDGDVIDYIYFMGGGE